MGCGCGKSKATSFVVTDDSGNCLMLDGAGNCVTYRSIIKARTAALNAGHTAHQVRPRT